MNAFTKFKVVIFSLDNLLLILGAFTMSLLPVTIFGDLDIAIALLIQIIGLLVLILVFAIKFRFAPAERGKIMPFFILYGIGYAVLGLLIGLSFVNFSVWLLLAIIGCYLAFSVILALLRVSFFGK